MSPTKTRRTILPVDMNDAMRERIEELLDVLNKLRKQDRSILRGGVNRAALMRYLMELGMEQVWGYLTTTHGISSKIELPKPDARDRAHVTRGRRPASPPPTEPEEPREDVLVDLDRVVLQELKVETGFVMRRSPKRKKKRKHGSREGRETPRIDPANGGGDGIEAVEGDRYESS